MFGGPEWIWVILVIVVIFGAARLPQVGRNLGRGIKEFKEGVGEGLKDDGKKPTSDHTPDEQKPLN
jgi:sec-independent protein translocase protein TatA